MQTIKAKTISIMAKLQVARAIGMQPCNFQFRRGLHVN